MAEAKAVRARCLVRRQCLAFALRTRQVHGVWGGLTEEERRECVGAGLVPAKPRRLGYSGEPWGQAAG